MCPRDKYSRKARRAPLHRSRYITAGNMCTKPLFSQRHSCYHCKFDYSILTDNVPAILQPRSDTHSNQADINDLRQLIRYHQDRESRRLYQKVAARKQDESDKSSDTAGREEPGVVSRSRTAEGLRSNHLIDGLPRAHAERGLCNDIHRNSLLISSTLSSSRWKTKLDASTKGGRREDRSRG